MVQWRDMKVLWDFGARVTTEEWRTYSTSSLGEIVDAVSCVLNEKEIEVALRVRAGSKEGDRECKMDVEFL